MYPADQYIYIYMIPLKFAAAPERISEIDLSVFSSFITTENYKFEIAEKNLLCYIAIHEYFL